MADKASEVNPLLRRPLYVYDLPAELLLSLTIAGRDHASTEVSKTDDTHEQHPKTTSESGVSTSTSCALCKVTYNTVQDQRQHAKSDFHRYNLKLSLKSLPLLDESTFIKSIGELDESLSGSDSSDSDEEGEESRSGDSNLAALLRRQAKISQQADENIESKPKALSLGNAPMLWLSSLLAGQDVGLGVYKALLSQEELSLASTSLTEVLRKKQLKPVSGKTSGKQHSEAASAAKDDPHFFLCMIGGGHFAAMIVSLVPELRKGPGGVEERHAVVHAHKTFHRYTTRRKQGGSQSVNDNAKGNAHSAGSSIRRYNEKALEEDVRAVLAEWKEMIDTAELLFIRATGVQNRKTLFGPYDKQVLRSNDKRLRGFPFTTRRATQAELLRSFQELTRLKIGKLVNPEPVKPIAEKAQHTDTKVKQTTPTLSKEEEAARLHTSQLQALIRRSKAPGVLIYLTKNELSPDFTFSPPSDHHHAPTPLHLSASTNSPALVLALITKAKSDPTIKNEDGKTAYDIAGDVATRDAFRVARSQLGESAWPWSATHIPSAITQEEADLKARSEKQASDAAEARRRKVDLDKIQKDEEARNAGRIERKAGPGKALSAAPEKTAQERREEEARGLTPEMRMRLERERRARAAEDRMRRMQGGS